MIDRYDPGRPTPARPLVFRLAGAWHWRCEHPPGCVVGDTVTDGFWSDPREVALGLAQKHWLLYHAGGEVVAVVDL